MDDLRLCESEARFMAVVWEAEPVPSGQLAKLCRERLGWQKSTTYTVLKKLERRGFLKNERAVVTALVPGSGCRAMRAARWWAGPSGAPCPPSPGSAGSPGRRPRPSSPSSTAAGRRTGHKRRPGGRPVPGSDAGP